jgi:hypothetical protein
MPIASDITILSKFVLDVVLLKVSFMFTEKVGLKL